MAKLTEEQVMLRDMAQTWVRNESPVSAWRKVRVPGHAEQVLDAVKTLG